MNELEGYGIKLHRLTEDKIEIVRRWRNDPKIQKYMDYKEYITEEQQKAWFEKINNKQNLFYIIIYKNKEVGLINIKNIDYTLKTGESGIFLWDDQCYGKKLSYRARTVLLDFVFDELKLEKIYSHVLNDNIRSQKSIISMGYKLIAGEEGKTFQKYELTIDNYYCNRGLILEKINKVI